MPNAICVHTTTLVETFHPRGYQRTENPDRTAAITISVVALGILIHGVTARPVLVRHEHDLAAQPSA